MITVHNARTEETIALKIRLEIGTNEDGKARYTTNTLRHIRGDMSAEDIAQFVGTLEGLLDGIIDKVYVDRRIRSVVYERDRPQAEKRVRRSRRRDPGAAASRAYFKEIEAGSSEREALEKAEAAHAREKERALQEQADYKNGEQQAQEKNPLYLQVKDLIAYLDHIYADAKARFKDDPDMEKLVFSQPALIVEKSDTDSPEMLAEQFAAAAAGMEPTQGLMTAQGYISQLIYVMPDLREKFEGKPDGWQLRLPLEDVIVINENAGRQEETDVDIGTIPNQPERSEAHLQTKEKTSPRAQNGLGGKLRKWWNFIDEEASTEITENAAQQTAKNALLYTPQTEPRKPDEKQLE